MKKVMLIVKSGPGARSRVEEALRLSAAMLGMDYPPVLVFVDDGVECLRPGAFSDPDLWDYLRTSADLAGVHVLSESLEERGLAFSDLDLRLGATAVDTARLAEMAAESD
ncbi:MAG: DsrE family protein, partial [Candidatus Bathyarchaeia archaeon]